MKSLIALMSCHNRREKTLASIAAFFQCELPEGITRKVVLVDDGSTDGTEEAVRAAFPDVIVERGDGNLFWNRGMLKAWQRSMPLNPDYVLWLNDDTLLYQNALSKLLESDSWCRREMKRPGIIVGSTQNDAGQLSYGGSVAGSAFNRLRMKKVQPGDRPLPVMTINGNCVLVSREIWEAIGLLDGVFHHSMGDNDYGFRAHKAGIPIWIIPGYAGYCNNDHQVTGSFNDKGLPLSVRWKKITSPKGVPITPWRALCRRHSGPLWPLIWLWPYCNLVATAMLRRAT